MTSPGFHRHDHGACVAGGLAAAEAACAGRAERLTPLRRRTLEILLESHKALGAYDVLARLAAEGFGSKPPVAYRALAFLVERGLAHRIEALSAFVACASPGEAHSAAFLVCRACRQVAEARLDAPLIPEAAAQGFAIERSVVEAQGLCPACQDPGRAP